METRTIFIDKRFPSVELLVIPTGLRIRNGKPGKPEEMECGEHPDLVAEAFYRGMAYASGK